MIPLFAISILFVLINAQSNELVKKALNNEKLSTIKTLDSTSLIEKMIKPTQQNLVIVTPYKNSLQNSYLQGTLKRLRTEKSAKVLYTRFGLMNSAATIAANRVIVRPQIRSTKAEKIEKPNLFTELETNNRVSKNAQKKSYTLNNSPKSYAAKLVPGVKVAPINSDQLEKIKITEVIDKISETMTPLNELEIKSDTDLQKALYRTTMRTLNYKFTKLEISTSLPFTTLKTTLNNINQSKKEVNLINNNINSLQAPTAQQLPQNITSNQFEQLGCGFDIITQTCKDVFQIGWCQHCTDFGHVFLHDCKCTAVSALYANSIASSVASARGANVPLNVNQTEQQSGQISHAFVPISFNNIPRFQSSQLQQPQQTIQQSAQPVILVPAPFIIHSQNLNQSEIFIEQRHPQQQTTINQNNAAFNFFNPQLFNGPQRSSVNNNLQSQSLQQHQQNTSLQAGLIPQTLGTSAIAFANPLQPFQTSVLQPHTPSALINFIV